MPAIFPVNMNGHNVPTAFMSDEYEHRNLISKQGDLFHLAQRPFTQNLCRRSVIAIGMIFKSFSKLGAMFCSDTIDVLPTELEAKRARRKRLRSGKRRKKRHTSASAAAHDGSAALLADVWCTPGIGLAMDSAVVDCVISRKSSITGRRRENTERALAEIRLLQPNYLRISSERYDQYRQLRLNTDNMPYEELLELGEKIGQVNTGLKEQEILCCVKKMLFTSKKLREFASSSPSELRCSICQEEYHSTDDVGKLNCGHKYHFQCIEQWLRRKNACPVCKVAAA